MERKVRLLGEAFTHSDQVQGGGALGNAYDGSLKVSYSSPLVSPSTTLNMSRGLYSIDVAATFEVPLTTVGDLHKLINDIEAGKLDELLSEMTIDNRMETMDAIGTICKSIKADNNNDDVIPLPLTTVGDLHKLINDIEAGKLDELLSEMTIDNRMETMDAIGTICKSIKADNNNDDVIPFVEKVSTLFEQTLYGYFIGKRMANNWGKHRLQRIMMNSKGFFFFKFDSRAGLEAVLEGGTWLICKSLIILKKWSMDTRLLKEELTRISIWVKLHDVSIQVFKEDDISLIATFIGKPIMLDSYTSSMCNESWGRSSFAGFLIKVNLEVDLVDVVTMGIPSLSVDGFTKETIHVEYEWRPPRCDICKIFGHVHDHFPKKVMSPPIVTTSNVVTPTVEKTNDEEDDEEDVQNMYDKSDNLLQNTKAGGSSSFMANAG
nr:zinc knuckle CX2CX4HX4C [Tanacetum cinerariifolium]